MRKRISSEVDYNILADLALGKTSIEIATKYGVSVSYVSKVRTGRKKINVYIPEQVKEQNLIELHASDIDRLTLFLKDIVPIGNTSDDVTLDSLIIKKYTELKILLDTREMLKEKRK